MEIITRFFAASALFVLLSFGSMTFGQKKSIDKEACDSWIMLQGSGTICSSGDYVTYHIGTGRGIDTLRLVSVDRRLNLGFANGTNECFSSDSRFMFAQLPNDTLLCYDLNGRRLWYLPNIKSFKVPLEGDGRWLAYSQSSLNNDIILKDLKTNRIRQFKEVSDYQFDNLGNYFILKSNSSLIYVDLKTGVKRELEHSGRISHFKFCKKGKRFAFLVYKNDDLELEYYKDGFDGAKSVRRLQDYPSLTQYEISDEPLVFDESGQILYLKLEKNVPTSDSSLLENISSQVTVWKYTDRYLQSELKARRKSSEGISYLAAVNLINGNIALLESDTDRVYNFNATNKFVLCRSIINRDEAFWNGEISQITLVSCHDGERILIANGPDSTLLWPQLSKNERFVIWFSQKDRAWYSYEIKTRKIRNFSNAISDRMYEEVPGTIGAMIALTGISWSSNDSCLYLEDRFDIWKLDPRGISNPICLTNGYGRKHKIKFYRVDGVMLRRDSYEKILLSGFNTETMQNGFWWGSLSVPSDPEICTMSDDLYFYPRLQGAPPQKAHSKNIYLLTRMNATDAPNLYITTDFKSYERITNIRPHQKYSWLTAELVRFTIPDGQSVKGILYKPENFDEKEKYPVIITYYEQRSDELNLYLKPELMYARINVPWFVNRGYVVFVTDIFFVKGHNGRSAVNSVMSGYQFLKKMSWIDATRIGLQGHSFGGSETNYIVTHTNVFSAAQSVAGGTDAISAYGTLRIKDGQSRHFGTEKGQGNIGCPPWECPDLYIEASSVLNIGAVTTPLMIVHNPNDNAVPYSQAVELFTGLWRAKKKVWLVEYANEAHNVLNYKNRLDFTIKTQEFFDHFLKNKPSPKWINP